MHRSITVFQHSITAFNAKSSQLQISQQGFLTIYGCSNGNCGTVGCKNIVAGTLALTHCQKSVRLAKERYLLTPTVGRKIRKTLKHVF